MRITFYISGEPGPHTADLDTACAAAAALAHRGHQATVACVYDLPRSKVFNKDLMAARHSLAKRNALREAFPRIPHIEKVHALVTYGECALPPADVIVATQPPQVPVLDCLPLRHGAKLFLIGDKEPPPHTGAVPVLCAGASKNPPPGFADYRYRFLPDGPADAQALENILKPLAQPGAADYWFRFTPDHASPAHHAPLRVLVVTCDLMACAQVRLFSALKRLEARGELTVRSHVAHPYSPPAAQLLRWANVLILQRIYHSAAIALMRRARAAGMPVIYEIDDNLTDIPADHADAGFWRRYPCMKSVISAADRITVSTSSLARALHEQGIFKPVTVLPNYLDPDLFPQPREVRDGDEIVVGYAGSRTHAADLAPCASALDDLLLRRRGKLRAEFMGYMPDSLAGNPHASLVNGSTSYHHYARLLSQTGWDIALAPLEKTAFNQSKSRIKYLEYAHCGMAGIFSDWGPYSRTVQNERTGLLVPDNTPDCWRQALELLIDNDSLRGRLRAQAAMDVGDSFLITDHLDAYRELFAHPGE